MHVAYRSTPGRASLPARVLGLACCAGGSLCLLSAAFPYSPESATRLALIVGTAGVLGGVALLRAGRRAPVFVLHGVVATTSVIASSFVAQATSLQEQLLTTIGYIWIGVYVACFFSQGVTLLHIMFMAGCYAVALWVSPLEPSGLVASVMMATACALSLMTNLLVSKMQQLVVLDPLTALLRRSAFLSYIEDDLDASARKNATPSLAILDLDGFKQVNDTIGHGGGDALLARLSSAWLGVLRRGDLLARYGGDEFALYMPATPLADAYQVVRRLERAEPGVTWSVGVTEWHGESLTAWIERTDRAMYDEKRMRRGEAAS